MATLYIENVPDELHMALRDRARQRSLASEVVSLLEENLPTAAELKRRNRFLLRVKRLGSRQVRRSPRWQSTEHMLREDRAR